jgi:hypothetical protein
MPCTHDRCLDGRNSYCVQCETEEALRVAQRDAAATRARELEREAAAARAELARAETARKLGDERVAEAELVEFRSVKRSLSKAAADDFRRNYRLAREGDKNIFNPWVEEKKGKTRIPSEIFVCLFVCF